MRSDPRYPLCMTIGDADLWWEADAELTSIRSRAASPCRDCCREFAEIKRAEQSCDGHYPGERVDGGFGRLLTGQWGYVDEAERIAARRRTWRESRRALRQATA